MPAPRGSRSRRGAILVARFLSAFALHLGVIVYLTWPLAAHLGTHVACPYASCNFDTRHAYWSQAWEVHATRPPQARTGTTSDGEAILAARARGG